MKIRFFVLFIMISQQFLFAVEQSELNLINKYSAAKVLTIDEGRDLVNQFWKQSFSSKQQATPVQNLVSGFQNLIQKLNGSQQSIAEQAYLMWLSGRTHGFNQNGE